MRIPRQLALLALLGGLPMEGHAQGASAALTEAEEVALARSAAPAIISDSADVYVRRGASYLIARRGTTGAACLVSWPRAGAVVPVCYDPRAAKSAMQGEFLAHTLRSAGTSPESADSAVEQAFRSGTLERPAAGALAWMMSTRQLFITPSGRNIGAWRPHIMVYLPAAQPGAIGFESVGRGDMFIDKRGESLAHVVVVTANWADGTRGPD